MNQGALDGSHILTGRGACEIADTRLSPVTDHPWRWRVTAGLVLSHLTRP